MQAPDTTKSSVAVEAIASSPWHKHSLATVASFRQLDLGHHCISAIACPEVHLCHAVPLDSSTKACHHRGNVRVPLLAAHKPAKNTQTKTESALRDNVSHIE
jgi:hypothetical protein